MTEEEIKALQEAKEAAEKRAAEAEAAAKTAAEEAEKAKNDVKGIVNELTEERRKKQEALEKLNLNNTNPGATGAPDVSELVKAELNRVEQERIKNELEQAVNEFKNSKTEFQADTTGVVFEKFKKEMSKFNFSDVTSKEQARQRLDEAYRFVKQSNPELLGGEHDGTPRTPATPPIGGERPNKEIESTLEAVGISQEKYQKLRTKYGEALESLGFGS